MAGTTGGFGPRGHDTARCRAGLLGVPTIGGLQRNRNGAHTPVEAADAVLWRAVGQPEFELLHRDERRAWPRPPGEQVFHPVLDEEFAVRIAVEWHVARDGIGYVARFRVDPVLFERYRVRPVTDRVRTGIARPCRRACRVQYADYGRAEVVHELRYA